MCIGEGICWCCSSSDIRGAEAKEPLESEQGEIKDEDDPRVVGPEGLLRVMKVEV